MSWFDFPNDLAEFSDSLRSQEETQDVADDLARDMGKFNATWRSGRRMSTGSSPIRIPPPRAKALHPRLCSADGAWMTFVFVGPQEDEGMPEIADMQVRVSGLLDVPSGPVEVEDHWRVDTDRYTTSAPREPHPSFHFQRGGHAQDSFAAHPLFVPGMELPAPPSEYWRGLMQSPAPRLPVPPMCPVLMLDFAISQHDGTIWQRLRSRADYSRIIASAQTRLWSPFFESLAEFSARRKWFGAIVG